MEDIVANIVGGFIVGIIGGVFILAYKVGKLNKKDKDKK